MAIDQTKQHPFLKAVDKAEVIRLWLPVCSTYIDVTRAAVWQSMNICLIRDSLPDTIDFRMTDDLILYVGGPETIVETPVLEAVAA